MTPIKVEIKECLFANLESGLDAWLLESGFSRLKNTLVYARELTEAVQRIEIAVEIHPTDRPDSAAAVYPWLEVNVGAVEKVVREMVSNDRSEERRVGEEC